MKVIESNCQTGEVTVRDMTPEEIAAAQAAHAAWLAAQEQVTEQPQATEQPQETGEQLP
jgi:hypothetical protein